MSFLTPRDWICGNCQNFNYNCIERCYECRQSPSSYIIQALRRHKRDNTGKPRSVFEERGRSASPSRFQEGCINSRRKPRSPTRNLERARSVSPRPSHTDSPRFPKDSRENLRTEQSRITTVNNPETSQGRISDFGFPQQASLASHSRYF